MRRLRALIPMLVSILVLGLCIAAALASRHRILRWGFSTLHSRYTFLIDQSRLFVRVPPPAKKQDAEAWELLKRLRNEDIQWNAEWISGLKEPLVFPSFNQDAPAAQLYDLKSASDEPFLRGLDGQKKFLAAHALLFFRERGQLQRWNLRRPHQRLIVEGTTGIRFDLRMAPPQPMPKGNLWIPIPPGALTIDSDQLPVIRDMWHDILDRTLFSFSIWWIAGGPLLVMALGCVGPIRRGKRQRLGLCAHCGYDLRASTGVCPECGLAINNLSSAPSAAT